MRNRPTLGTEIISVTVKDGHAREYMDFEAHLTRLLNQMYPNYHYGADIYQATDDPNTFIITALYNNSLNYATEISADLESFVKDQYAANFPYVVSRYIATEQGENHLMDHCYTRFF